LLWAPPPPGSRLDADRHTRASPAPEQKRHCNGPSQILPCSIVHRFKIGLFQLFGCPAQPFIYLFVDRSIARSRVRSARTGGYFEQAAAAALEAFELFELLAAMEAAIFNLACEFEKAKATSIKKKAEPKRFIYDP